MSHLIFLIDCQFLVPEKMTVTEVFIQGIYIPLISVPEFAVTKVKITEFSYNHWYRRHGGLLLIHNLVNMMGLKLSTRVYCNIVTSIGGCCCPFVYSFFRGEVEGLSSSPK